MLALLHRVLPVALVLAVALLPAAGQDAPSLPPVPEGVEVQARGPVHEAYAGPTSEPVPTTPIGKKPPAAIDEVPPAEKPSGNMIWISGYWAYDDDRKDFLWVSGIWRAAPPGKQWVAGYWREQGDEWQWVPGFWARAPQAGAEQDQQITYLPQPPALPAVASPVAPANPDVFFVPGCWIWNGAAYVYRAGYWARRQPNYVWVPDHYRWSPSGYVYVAGYWDLTLRDRGLLYAPVVISPRVLTVGFTYTPYYAVRDTVVVDALFVRPCTCHYYFGDYYGPAYRTWGYESCVVYSQRNYDSIICDTYAYRDPGWLNVQINLYNDRCAGRAVCPPRTLVQQNNFIQSTTINNTVINRTVVNNVTMIAPPTQVAQAKNVRMVALDPATRQQARVQAASVQQVAHQRIAAEKPLPLGAPRQARVASLSVPAATPVKPGMVAPRPTPWAVSNATAATLRPAPAMSHPAAGRPAYSSMGSHPAAQPGTPSSFAQNPAGGVFRPNGVHPGSAMGFHPAPTGGLVRPGGVHPGAQGHPVAGARPGAPYPGMAHPPRMPPHQRPAPRHTPDHRDPH